MLSSLSNVQVANSLSELVSSYATVHTQDFWRPRGFIDPGEPELCKTTEFLPREICEEVSNWWLAVRRGARTPVWDIAATCSVPGYERKGIVIVESKAHCRELSEDGKKFGSNTNRENHQRIGDAIQEANSGLRDLGGEWNLTRDSHYQLSNRFAWAWKIIQLGIPVVLVYLGFLNATEMNDPFSDDKEWRNRLLAHAQGIVPEEAWGTQLISGNAPLIPLIRSVDFTIDVSSL